MSKTRQQELDEFRKVLADFRKLYTDDGTITPDEQSHLDALEEKIERVDSALAGQAAGNGKAVATGGISTKTASTDGAQNGQTSSDHKVSSKQSFGVDKEESLEYFLYKDVESARAAFLVQQLEASAFCEVAADLLHSADKKFTELFRVYGEAYKLYAAAIKAGGAEADNQEMWKNIVIGTAASIAVAAVGAVAVPAAAAATLAKTAGTWLAYNSVSAAVGSGAGAAVGEATKFDKEGLDPSREASTEVQKLKVWRQFADLGKTVAVVSKTGAYTVLAVDVANYAMAEIRRHVEGGTPDMSVEDTVGLAESIVEFHQAYNLLSLSGKTEKLRKARTAVESLTIKSQDAMEQDIWILWMGGLKSDSGVLDYDEIEDRLHEIGVLGSGSRLGVDFGGYTSDADEAAAIKAAKTAAADIKKEYDKLGIK